MPTETIQCAKRGRVVIATLNRPEALNAFSIAMLRRLLEILRDLAVDESSDALVITGAGRAFSAGIDLKELARSVEASDGSETDSLPLIQTITREIVGNPKIIIAAVNGGAVGLGAELSVACDIRIAAHGATFAFPEVKRSLFVTGGVTYLLPRIVGLGRAMDWLLSGRTVMADEASAAGLLAHTVASEELLQFAVQRASEIAASDSASVHQVKQSLHRTFDADLESALQLEAEIARRFLGGEGFKESVRAFLEKRSPDYK